MMRHRAPRTRSYPSIRPPGQTIRYRSGQQKSKRGEGKAQADRPTGKAPGPAHLT